jgi:hypothetical protein
MWFCRRECSSACVDCPFSGAEPTNTRRTIAFLTIAVLTVAAPAVAGEGPKGSNTVPPGTPWGVPYSVFDAINQLWAAIDAIQRTPGPAGPQGPPGESALRVVDSLGQTVGAFLAQDVPPAGYQQLAVAAAGNQRIFLLVNSNGFRENYVNALYHTSRDCSGQRYIAIGNAPSLDPAVIVAPTQPAAVQRGYAVFSSGPITVASVASREYFAPGADYRSPGLCEAFDATMRVTPASGLELATLQVMPPFRIQ